MMGEGNRRRFPRFPVLVEIRYDSNSPALKGRITDVGEGGIFVDTVNPLPSGAVVRFRFSPSSDPADPAIAGAGRVAWNQQTVGMGIEFTQVSAEDRQRLKVFLDGLS